MARNNNKKYDPSRSNRKENFRKSNSYRGKNSSRPRGNAEDSTQANSTVTSGDSKLSSLNDFSWYNRYPELIKTAASVAFPNKPGMSFNFLATQNSALKGFDYTIPGVLALEWYPTIGRSVNTTDPASIAAKELYAKVRSRYSGSLDADAPDFMIYLLALDSIFAYIGTLKRIYRLLNAYSPFNFTTPDMLLQALGVSTQSANALRADRANFNHVINELIHMTEKFKCPAVMDIFTRHYWMNDNVYLDSPSPLGQFYVFKQKGYFKFSMLETYSNPEVQAGGLIMVETPFDGTTKLSVNQLFTFGRLLIDALSDSDDGYTISGYLMRAFEGVSNFSVDLIGVDEVSNPVYVPEVLAQIENSFGVVLGNTDVVAESLRVQQDVTSNALIHKPRVSLDPRIKVDELINPYLSIRSDAPSEVDVVLASRLCASLIYTGDLVEIICGTEIPCEWKLYIHLGDGFRVPSYTHLRYAEIGDVTHNSNILMNEIRVNAFDWHPINFIRYENGTLDPPTAFALVNGDVHNITTLTNDILAQIHKVCVYSEFNAFESH